MKIMDRKVLREIKNQKFRSLLIISIVTVTSAMILGMRGGHPMIMATYEENLRVNNVADGRFTFRSPIFESNVSQIKSDAEFMNSHQIADIEGRLILHLEIKYQAEKFPCIVIGVNFPNSINQVYIEEMDTTVESPTDVLNTTTNCIIESLFAGTLFGQDISLGENVTLLIGADEFDFSIRAVGQDTDFVYVVDPVSQMTLMGQLAVIWVDLTALQEIVFGGLPMINQVLFTVTERLEKPLIMAAQDALKTRFASNNIDISGLEFTIFDETIDWKFFDADAGSMDKVGTIFGIIGLIMCCVAIYNTISRLVQSQRKNVGLFMSMGANASEIIWHYVKITMLLSFIGLLLGISLGHFFAIGITQLLVRFFPFQAYLYPIMWNEYILISVIVFAVCVAFSGLSAYPITRITPREAMSAFFNQVKATKAVLSEKIFGWIPGFQSIHMRVPIREIFLRKRKSTITILAITTSMIMMITSIAMTANMYGALNRNFEEYNTADYQIQFETSIPMSAIHQFMGNLSENDILDYETTITVYSSLIQAGEVQGGFIIECYQANSTLRNLNIVDKEISDPKDITSDEIILGIAIADKFDILLGDVIQIGLLDNHTVQVVGLVGELIDYTGFMTIEAFHSNNMSLNFGIPMGYVSGLLLNVGAETDVIELREKFDTTFAISQWIDANQSHQSILSLMQSMLSMLILFILVGMIIGVLFSFNTMYMGFLNRENDFLAFKAMGTSPKYFVKMIFWENALLSLFSLILTIPVGYFAYWQSMDYMIEKKFYIPLSIPWYTWPGVLLLSLVSIWMATRRLTKKINNMNLADELRSRMIT